MLLKNFCISFNYIFIKIKNINFLETAKIQPAHYFESHISHPIKTRTAYRPKRGNSESKKKSKYLRKKLGWSCSRLRIVSIPFFNCTI